MTEKNARANEKTRELKAAATVMSRKFMVFLFASMVILRPLDLKISLTSCFVFSICFCLVLHTARPSLW